MIDITPSTLFHIAAGSVALASGLAAVVVRKGGPAHRAAGGAFVVSMLAMCASGSWLAVSKLAGQDAITAQIGAFTAYLVLTSWAAARTPPGVRSRLQIALAGCGAALTAGFVLAAPHSEFYPLGFGLFIAGLAGLSTVLDLKALVRPLAGGARITRHLWRMLFAMFIASASVFVGQQDEFPAVLQSNLWFIPAFAPLVFMLVLVTRRALTRVTTA